MAPVVAHAAVWTIAIVVTFGILVRPFRLPEAIWAVLGAALLLLSGLMSIPDGIVAVNEGRDVYLFLIGMMLLSEAARVTGLFDWIASHAVNHARGSTQRLFLLIYGVGIIVTALLSNDATAVVLTPAVFAAAQKAKADPLPLLFICALIANAASFVLPISNPANIVLYGGHTPPLGQWLASFALPSVASIIATFVALRWVEARRLALPCAPAVDVVPLTLGGKAALAGILVASIALLTVSFMDIKLGLPTCILGVLTTIIVLACDRRAPLPVLKDVSWSVLPLVAGLFVIVDAVGTTGLTAWLAELLNHAVVHSVTAAAAGAGGLIALACNAMNNLPAGLITSSLISTAKPPQQVIDTLLIGVDLGPNLSITGSLATILWLTAIRREGEAVGFWRFFRVGVVVMPPALILAIAARLLFA